MRLLRSTAFTLCLGTGALGLLIALAYWPALYGGFLFDDAVNLSALGRYGPIVDGAALLRYLSAGIADPTGRPVSLLSFLIDSRDWPAEAFAFKRTNLVIHIIVGLLLVAALARLGTRLPLSPASRHKAALAAAALWWLHPLWVSTVAYVVQRHAMLSALFALAGIVVWTYAQDAFDRGQARRGWILALFAVGGCGLLAGLSKANGFLLPVLLLMLQVTVLRPSTPSASTSVALPSRAVVTLLLVLPSLCIVAMLAWRGVVGWDATHGRPWTVGQRLLTQPRVLIDYLELLAWPRIHSPGLFGDGFIVSRGLLRPWTTLPALLVVLALPALAFAFRRRWPALAAATLFFFAAHLLESTSIPLELSFEHRNYLPAMLLGWPLGIALTAPGRNRRVRTAILLMMLAVLTALTVSRAGLWGSNDQLALTWGTHLPHSPRAQTNAALHEISSGQPQQAISRLQPLLDASPAEPQFALTLLDAECSTGKVRAPTLRAAIRVVRASGAGQDMVHGWLRGKLESPPLACDGFDESSTRQLVAAAHRPQPQSASARNRLAQLDGLLALRERRCADAVRSFNLGLVSERHAAQVFGQTGMLATHCGPRAGLDHLLHYRRNTQGTDTPAHTPMLRLHQRVLASQGYWQHEMDRLEALLHAEALTEATQEPSP